MIFVTVRPQRTGWAGWHAPVGVLFVGPQPGGCRVRFQRGMRGAPPEVLVQPAARGGTDMAAHHQHQRHAAAAAAAPLAPAHVPLPSHHRMHDIVAAHTCVVATTTRMNSPSYIILHVTACVPCAHVECACVVYIKQLFISTPRPAHRWNRLGQAVATV